MKHVKYFSKRLEDGTVKRFSSKNGYVRRFSADSEEISLSSIDPDKYYLYKDSNVTIPGFAIDQGSYIVSGSKHSRGYKLTKAYGPFDSAADAEAYASESGINLIDTTAVVDEQPEVSEMSGNDDKLAELEAKVDSLTELVTELSAKISVTEENTAEESAEDEVPEEETSTEEESEEAQPEETTVEEEPEVVEESSEEVCPICGQDPCICGNEVTADLGLTEDDIGLGEQVPANTGKVQTFYTQVPEDDIIAQFSNGKQPEPENVAGINSANDSMFSVLFK